MYRPFLYASTTRGQKNLAFGAARSISCLALSVLIKRAVPGADVVVEPPADYAAQLAAALSLATITIGAPEVACAAVSRQFRPKMTGFGVRFRHDCADAGSPRRPWRRRRRPRKEGAQQVSELRRRQRVSNRIEDRSGFVDRERRGGIAHANALELCKHDRVVDAARRRHRHRPQHEIRQTLRLEGCAAAKLPPQCRAQRAVRR